jgi:hypothetical protein|nr:MAG TPA: hypothetical protein [Caudoviricetes sp.]DAV01827.1 MAG TPA: hypothetical protein [Caudoviricetes sp.]
MKHNSYEYPKSSLLGMPKDAAIIIDRILSNPNLLRLLVYETRDWQSQPLPNGEQIKELFTSHQISSVPKIKIDSKEKTYIRLTYGTVIRNASNPEYRDNTFGIDIICHYDNWDLGDFELRPYRVAGEIDAMLDKTHLTGIGELEFVSATPYVYNEEFAGVSLTYLAVRGHED